MAKSKKVKAKKSPKFIGMSKLAQHVADYLNDCANVDTGGEGRVVFLHDVIHSVVLDILYPPKDEPVEPQSSHAEDGTYPVDESVTDGVDVEAVFISVYRKAVHSDKFTQALWNITSSKNNARVLDAQGDHVTLIGGFNHSYVPDNYQFNGIIYKKFVIAPISLYAVPRVTNVGDETAEGIISLSNN